MRLLVIAQNHRRIGGESKLYVCTRHFEYRNFYPLLEFSDLIY